MKISFKTKFQLEELIGKGRSSFLVIK